jgi:hypothetical protein
MLDRPMAEVCLQGSRIEALVCQGEATGMPQLMRVDLELEARCLASPRYELLEAADSEGCPPLTDEHEWAG